MFRNQLYRPRHTGGIVDQTTHVLTPVFQNGQCLGPHLLAFVGETLRDTFDHKDTVHGTDRIDLLFPSQPTHNLKGTPPVLGNPVLENRQNVGEHCRPP